MFITSSCAIISFSILSLCPHFKSISENIYSLLVFSLTLNEVICGLYLISISLANIIYSANFYHEQDIWRSSTICFAVSGLVIWYKISSLMHNILLSLSRLMVVIRPIGIIFRKFGFAPKIIIFIYTSSFILSVIFTTLHKIAHGTQTTSFCFPFVDPTKKVFLVKLIVWLVALTEIISSVIIIVLHIQLVIKVKKSEKNTRICQHGKCHLHCYHVLFCVFHWLDNVDNCSDISNKFYCKSMYLHCVCC